MKKFFVTLGVISLMLVALTQGSTPFHIGKAIIISAPAPVWPFGGRIRRTTRGMFILRLRPNGTVARVDIAQSCGYQTFDLATMDAFYKWRFGPGSAENVQIPVIYKVDSRGIRIEIGN
jgi:TonB family protein